MTFTACINVEIEARDEEQALEIMSEVKAALTAASPYKLGAVEIDDVEEL